MKTSLHSSGHRTRGVYSVASSVVSAICLVVLFRLTLELESLAAVGLWALLQGLFLISRIAGSGLGSNITRHVAVLQREGLPLPVGPMMVAGMLIGVVPVLAISGLAFHPITEFVHRQYGAQFSEGEIDELAALCVLAGVLSAAAIVLLAISEGLGHLRENSMILIGANLLSLATVYPLLETFGLAGIGLTYVVSSAGQLIGASAWLAHISAPHRGHATGIRNQLAELTSDSVHLTSIGVLRLTFEPVTKLLLASVGTLGAVAAFELALRVSTQARIFFQAGVQPLLVHASRRERELSTEMAETFERGQRALSEICALALVCLACGSAAVSFVGLGRADGTFLLYFGILATANMINSAGLLGYFYQLSAGHLWPLLKIHLLMAALNLAAGTAGALVFDEVGVVAAYAGTLTLGGVLLIRSLPTAVRGGSHGTHRLWGASIAASLALLSIAAAVPENASGPVAVALGLSALFPMAMAYRSIPGTNRPAQQAVRVQGMESAA